MLGRSEVVSTMLWNLSLKEEFHRYNSLDMDKDVNTKDQKFAGVEFQNLPTDYHT